MTDTISYRRSGHIGRLLLDNPARHNALGQAELDAIQSQLTAVAADQQVRVLVVTGRGEKTFCAGAALDQLGAGKISGDSFQRTTDQLAGMAIPTVCALQGSAFGGGVELALSCDFRIGVEGSRMRVPAAAIGLCYPISGINRYVERLGVNLAKRILMTAEEFDASAMLAIGFLDQLVPATELETATEALAQRIAGLAPLAVRSMKEILQQAAGGTINEARAQQLSKLCAQSADLQEGLRAQRDKRRPNFSGS